MSTQMIEKLRLVDFGEIDGYGDPNLERYFLDDGYWKKIIESNIFFVVGKKGTGKSSIYRMIGKRGIEEGAIICNKDFGEFPFERLLQLNDDSFAKPNQYQTIWKNVLFNLFAQNIAKLPNENNTHYQEIKKYVETYIGSVEDLHRQVISNTKKSGGSLLFNGFGLQKERNISETYSRESENLTLINSALGDLITNYLLTSSFQGKIIIQFDRLDDNYNQYQNVEEYYQAIISLLKVVYAFNQSLREKHINNAKVIVYIRSDIMRELALRDSESARWDDFRYDIIWSINNLQDWKSSNLLKMLEKRITSSSQQLENMTFHDVFCISEYELKQCDIRSRNFFKALILETLFRPRDLIKLCKTLQEEILRRGIFSRNVYKNALKKYSNWLVNTELANEINPVLGSDYKHVIELLRLCGSVNMSVTSFTERYRSLKVQLKYNVLELLEFLYNVGIIENTWFSNKEQKTMHRSIYRNEGDFDRNMKFRILPPVWRGLTV